MEINQNSSRGRVKHFFKKYAYFFITFLCVSLIALIVALTSTVTTGNEGELEVNAGVVTFALPVVNATIDKEYSGETLLYNLTLKQWEAHKALDFKAVKGTEVLSVYDGVVKNVYTNTLEGTVVVIEHANNLQTLYGSLDSAVMVEVGDEVEKGDAIGKASDTATNEAAQGSHVHFEVWKDGAKVDPAAYLNLEGK